MENVLKETYKGFEIEIVPDQFGEDPRNWDNIGEMICFHRRYSLGDKHDFSSPEDFENSIQKGDIVLPLYLYDHSGITISTSPFSCPWDSGQVGYIIARKENIKKEFKGVKGQKKKVLACLESEVKIYDQYLRGEVYGFVVEDIDSCSGFYGESGISNALKEAREIIDYHLRLESLKHQTRVKAWIKNRIPLIYRVTKG